MSELAAALRSAMAGDVRDDAYTRHLFSTDASMYRIEPLAVAFPRDAADVAAAMSVCAEHGTPLLPRGAGTSLAGQTVGRAVILDTSRHMDAIVAIDPQAGTARVQPGVVQDDLNRAAARHGLLFGPDTSTSNRATIGGMIGNNSAGSGSVIYGMTIDHVHSLDVVLSDASTAAFGPADPAELSRRAQAQTLEGRLYRRLPALVEEHRLAIGAGFPDHWRRAGGYRLDRLAGGSPFDLARFVVGSEGTLAVTTEATVQLVPLPRARAIAVGHFATVTAAIAATEDALALGPSAVELIDKTILDLSRRKLEYAALGSILEGDPGALLFVTFNGDSPAEAAAGLETLAAVWQRHGHGYHTLRATTAAQQGALLTVRSAGLGLLMAASTGTRRPVAFIEDTAVDPARLSEYTARFAAVLDSHGLVAGFYGHCSVGCLHIRPFMDLTNPAEVATMRVVAEEIRDLVREFGGANSSEHGDGLARSEFNARIFGDELYEAMREVKRLFDPQGLLNPGKIVDAPPMTHNLRDPALPLAPPLATRISFAATGDMRGAADRCMNIGVCRKGSTGVMCPSYMATREEEHSTRGRANALVRALSQPDPQAALGDQRLHEILDLCLECKACKSECPLGVDMASMKSEFLFQYQTTHGVPPRARFFAAARTLNRLGSATAPLSNWLIALPGSRALMERGLRVTRRRPLPQFERTTLLRWFAERSTRPTPPRGTHSRAGAAHTAAPTSRRAAPSSRGTVALLADSFTTFTEPAVGIAAVELLEMAGWRVELIGDQCCGRAAISKGRLDAAARSARAMTQRLAGLASQGVPIVGVEPSCILTLTEEHLTLQPGSEDAALVARQVRPVDELLVDAIDAGHLRLDPGSALAGCRILFHGHCHQKALAGTASTVRLLSRIPGATVVELDAGCCGMAGSFGFEAEHYQLSMQIGGLRLFPAVRAEPATTVIAATGVSCRQQIDHGTRRVARHPIELIREAARDPAGSIQDRPRRARSVDLRERLRRGPRAPVGDLSQSTARR
ncbi:MAG: FAD-binding protein [Candidatus Dormibacteraeota bacterium]|uniref:FAD-binding protein n=1 Tax=Candidatus Amunia macphersoniae TaxID=3127014 RepID=A0A934KRN0_9BACT|nr:FAD-binding protein [Candidatus Dormibacteraeota bacterium]